MGSARIALRVLAAVALTAAILGGETAAPAAAVSTASPRLVVQPAHGVAGGAVRVTGYGFQGRSLVRLSWDWRVRVGIVHTGPGGTFRATLTVPPVSGGVHAIAATTVRTAVVPGRRLTSTSFTVAAASTVAAFSIPFLSRPAHGQIHLRDCSNVTVSGYSFSNITDDAIIIENCSNVTITANDFSDDVGGVYVLNSKNVTVTANRFRNIGDGTIGSGHSNYVQFNNTWGGYIGHNKGVGGRTEDMISLYKSGGLSQSSPLVVEYNAFQGTNWTSGSGSGAMLGDAGGSHIVARYNTLLSPGQVGIGVPSGSDIHVTDNTIYGATRPRSNVGIYVWNQASSACDSIEVARNHVHWYRDDGHPNGSWDGGNCGSVAGWSTNDWSAPIDPAGLAVTL